MKRTLRLMLAAAALSGCSGAATERAPASPFPNADRPVAEIVSNQWASETMRDRAGENAQIVRALGIRSGMTVADIGAGSGYHTVRLSEVVEPTGRVLAVDVSAPYLEQLRERVDKAGLTNVTTILGRPDDPRLPPRSTDVALMVHMYHEIESPYAMLYHLAPALKPGGRLAVVDLDRPTEQHGTPPALLRCELAAVGWRQVSITLLSGDVGYLAVFEPMERPAPASIRPCPNRIRR